MFFIHACLKIPIKTLGSASKIRVGRATENTGICLFVLSAHLYLLPWVLSVDVFFIETEV